MVFSSIRGMRGFGIVVIGIMVLCLIGVPMDMQLGEDIELESEVALSLAFPVENYDFTVSLEPHEWDYVLSYGIYGDALHGVFDVVPYLELIDFFICDYDNLLEWASGNISIERYSVYEASFFAYWTFIPPYDALWYYVFVNNNDLDTEVWVMENFDTAPPHVGCSHQNYNTYESPVDIEIMFNDIWFNVSYYSVYLYGDLLEEATYTSAEASSTQTFSRTFTLDDLEGTSGRLEFTGYTNDTAGNGESYSFNIHIVEPISSTTSSSTSTTHPVDSEPPNFFLLIFLVGVFSTCCIVVKIGQRLFHGTE